MTFLWVTIYHFSRFCSISLSFFIFTWWFFFSPVTRTLFLIQSFLSFEMPEFLREYLLSMINSTVIQSINTTRWLIVPTRKRERAKQIKATNNHRNEGNSSVKRRSFRQRGHVRSILNHSSRQARWKTCSQAKRSVLFELNPSRQIRHWSSLVSVLFDDARSRSR